MTRKVFLIMGELYHDISQLSLFSEADYIEIDQLSLFDIPPIVAVPDTTHFKFCISCKNLLSLDDFSVFSNTKKDGSKQAAHRNQCKACIKRLNLERNTKRPELSTDVKKKCSKCDEEKLLKHFSKDSNSKYGRRSLCKECEQKQKRDYRAANPERMSQIEKKRYAAHREDRNKRTRNYYMSHREEVLEVVKAWRAANILKCRAIGRRREARKKKVSTENVNYSNILERDGMHCYICEQDILPHHSLHFDHIIPLVRGGAHSEENIKPTHAQCNLRKNSKLLSELDAHAKRGVTG